MFKFSIKDIVQIVLLILWLVGTIGFFISIIYRAPTADDQCIIKPVIIVDAYHEEASQSKMFGMDWLPVIYHPSKTIITVAYAGRTFTLDNDILYERYCDCVGKTVDAVIEITTYYDGDTTQKVLYLEGDAS